MTHLSTLVKLSSKAIKICLKLLLYPFQYNNFHSRNENREVLSSNNPYLHKSCSIYSILMPLKVILDDKD